MSEKITMGMLSIGAFAHRSRLSLKALRLYDELGLLPPARVDPETGYRSYAEEQLRPARLIGLLRRIEMPLERIARVLGLPAPDAVSEVADFWAEVEASMTVKRELVAFLERHLEGRGEAMYEIKVRSVPEQRVLTMQRALFVRDLPPFIDEAMGRLQALAGEHRIPVSAAAPFVVYHGEVNDDSDGPVEVCLPVDRDVLAEGDDVRLRSEPAQQEAFTRLVRSQVDFPGILDAYAALERWIRVQGREMAGSPREVYFSDSAEHAPDDPFCDVAWPISEGAVSGVRRPDVRTPAAGAGATSR